MSISPIERIPADLPARGTAIYDRTIRSLIEPGQHGKFVVIDVFTGDYEIGERDADATRRLLDRRPSAMTWAVRVGYPTPYVWLSTRPAVHD